MPARFDQRGFSYIGLLLVIAVMTTGLAAAAQVWHTLVQRASEAELLFVGAQFKLALEGYYERSPGAKVFPRALEDLVLDTRHPVVVRHLRRIYIDPMTRSAEWGLVKHEERIVGIFSLSEKTPMTARGPASDVQNARKYSEWRFVADVHAGSHDPANSGDPSR